MRAVLATSVAVLLALAIVAGARGDAAAPSACRPGTPFERAPGGLLPLEANSIARASAVALARESRRDRPLLVSAVLASRDRGRGPQVRHTCGARAWKRTVIVYITLRAYLPSASLSSRVLFVGRFRDGYRVWQIAH
jgi:hypothetical protein